MNDDGPSSGGPGSIYHWSVFGQQGSPAAERYVPDADRRTRLTPLIAPATGTWPDVFDGAQTQALLRGFEPEVMEDKWLIWSEDPDAEGRVAVHFHRSWTGAEVIRIDLQLTDTGSTCVAAAWAAEHTEEFARTTLVEVCRWVLGLRPTSTS